MKKKKKKKQRDRPFSRGAMPPPAPSPAKPLVSNPSKSSGAFRRRSSSKGARQLAALACRLAAAITIKESNLLTGMCSGAEVGSHLERDRERERDKVACDSTYSPPPHSAWRTVLKLTCLVCGTNMSTLKRKRARVSGFEFRFAGSGPRVWSFGIRVSVFGFGFSCSGFRVSDF